MKSFRSITALCAGVLFLCALKTQACSGYKITLDGKTMVGANEDAWRLTLNIWFENGMPNAPIGAAFTGSRFDGANGYAPQSGMNEAGLCFQRLAAPRMAVKSVPGKKPIENPTRYLKDILHQCQTVEEVQRYISQYQQGNFREDVFLYVDKSGHSLTVEPATMTLDSEAKYVISNFCPSITTPEKANELARYRNGAAFLQDTLSTTLAFCIALSDTMHVCRPKVGDGTLLTSIYDLNAGTVNLYFYHSYDHTVQFRLADELKKGNHSLAVASLFPPNKDFERLRDYQTPQNNSTLLLFLIGSIGLFNISALYFVLRAFRKKAPARYQSLLLFPAALFLSYYLFHLVQDAGPFFFPAPYKDPSSFLRSVSSFLPFALPLAAVPLFRANYRLFKQRQFFADSLLSLNVLSVVMLLGLFTYWGFYQVW